MENIFVLSGTVLAVLAFLCLYRAYIGPSAADRVVAINVVGTKVVAIIALVSYAFSESFFLDVALVYALISFIATIGVAKYLEKGALE